MSRGLGDVYKRQELESHAIETPNKRKKKVEQFKGTNYKTISP